MKNIFFVFSIVLLFTTCKKNQLGGKSTVKGIVAHHHSAIPYARVFIKFDSKEFPGKDTTQYDSKILTGSDGSYSFDCYKGNYYLYGYGFDTAISEIVSGGLHTKVRNNEDLNLEVAVTED